MIEGLEVIVMPDISGELRKWATTMPEDTLPDDPFLRAELLHLREKCKHEVRAYCQPDGLYKPEPYTFEDGERDIHAPQRCYICGVSGIVIARDIERRAAEQESNPNWPGRVLTFPIWWLLSLMVIIASYKIAGKPPDTGAVFWGSLASAFDVVGLWWMFDNIRGKRGIFERREREH